MKQILIAVAAASMLVVLVAPALSQYEGDVMVGQQVVLRVRYPAGGYSIEERAAIVTQRINRVLGSRPFNPSEVTTDVRNNERVVLIGNDVLITVDEATARYNKTTPANLAEIWASNLRQAIPKAKAEPEPEPEPVI